MKPDLLTGLKDCGKGRFLEASWLLGILPLLQSCWTVAWPLRF